jgi:flavin-dependent dehydrogenase
VVIGGGPAGSAAARLLAEWGHDVVLLAGARGRSSRLAESLPPSCRKLLATIGALDDIEAGGFVATRGNTSAWGNGVLSVLPFEGGATGFQVTRGRLDELLLDHADTGGAVVIPGGTAREVDLPAHPGDPARIRWTTPGGRSGTLTARWVLDASGRAGVVARQGFRCADNGASTLALLGSWSRPGGWLMEDESHTLVESYEEGWVWSVPVGRGIRHVAAMVDPRRTALSRGRGLDAMYRAELARTTHMRALLDGAVSHQTVWACNASTYGARTHSAPGMLLIGDAGSFLDPLSSFGVKKALASGWLAAVTTHTALIDPGRTGLGLSLFEERERVAEEGYHAQTARYYAEAAEAHDGPYWRVRAAQAAGVRASRPDAFPEADSERLLRHPRLPAAFEYLRREDPLRLRAAPELRREMRPTVRGCEIVLQEHLFGPTLMAGIHSIRGVQLPRLVDLVDRYERVPDLYEAYSRDDARAGLPDFLCALSALIAAGVVEGAPNN